MLDAAVHGMTSLAPAGSGRHFSGAGLNCWVSCAGEPGSRGRAVIGPTVAAKKPTAGACVIQALFILQGPSMLSQAPHQLCPSASTEGRSEVSWVGSVGHPDDDVAMASFIHLTVLSTPHRTVKLNQ